MITIAVVDDEKEERTCLLAFFQKMAQKLKEEMHVDAFASGEEFLSSKDRQYDLVCLDIDMEGRDGIETAKEIRKQDEEILIIFVTNLAHMAIRGYEVRALDFILKPVNFYSFSMKIQNAISMIQNKKSKTIVISTMNGVVRFSTNELYYAEVDGHYIYYHTKDGSYKQKQSMKELEDLLAGLSFKRCNNCYLVNLKYVDAVDWDDVKVGGEWLKISRPRKKEFLQALANYMGGIKI